MTPQQIQLVRNTFDKIAPIAPDAARLFYARLFELDPSLRSMFPADLTEQGKKLMQALAFVVASLERPDALLPVVRALGARHVGYGVRDEHYATVGAALLWTLGRGLGADFTPDAHQAWSQAYALLASEMKAAAAKAA